MWKKYVSWEAPRSGLLTICDMCIQLQLESFYGIKQQVLNDLEGYWKPKGVCKTPNIIDDNFLGVD